MANKAIIFVLGNDIFLKLFLLKRKLNAVLQLMPPTHTPNPNNHDPNREKLNAKAWLKRLGVAGFLFFLAKGLVWVAIFAGAAKACQ